MVDTRIPTPPSTKADINNKVNDGINSQKLILFKRGNPKAFRAFLDFIFNQNTYKRVFCYTLKLYTTSPDFRLMIFDYFL